MGKNEYEKWVEKGKERRNAIREGNYDKVVELTKCQEQLLYNNGISRVERERNNAFVDKKIRLFEDENDKESLRENDKEKLKKNLFETSYLEIKTKDIEPDDFIFLQDADEEVYYIYSENSLYRANDIYGSFDWHEIEEIEEKSVYKVECDENKYYILEKVEKPNAVYDKIDTCFKHQETGLRYLKEVPCLYSFSDEYKLIKKGINANEGYIINSGYKKYEEIKCSNLRYVQLEEDIFKNESNKLLFMPPSMPHYKLRGVYEKFNDHTFSKMLIFSSLNATPRSIAALLSYSSEQRNYNKEYEDLNNCDNKSLQSDVICSCQQKAVDGKEDLCYLKKRKYLFNGKHTDGIYLHSIENRKVLDDEYEKYKKDRENTNYLNVVKAINENGKYEPENGRICGSIIGYLFDLYDKFSDQDETGENDCKKAKVIDVALEMYKIFTTKEAYHIINSENLPLEESSYMEKINSYCAAGNIRAVLDEYIELLLEKERIELIHKDGRVEGISAKELFDLLKSVFKSLFSNVGDSYVMAKINEEENKVMIYTDFAVGHYCSKSKQNGETVSSANTLNKKLAVFNSPFRPFVFTSTSVGQEGFDFHLYCRKIVHWGLVYDPVKFEQREGRINRFHSLCVRANRAIDFINNNRNVSCSIEDWIDLFSGSVGEKILDKSNQSIEDETGGLVPDWYYIPDDTNKYLKLERSCYYYPCSRESAGFEEVKKACNLYRALLGQSDLDCCYEDDIDNLKRDKNYNIKDICVDLNPLSKSSDLNCIQVCDDCSESCIRSIRKEKD